LGGDGDRQELAAAHNCCSYNKMLLVVAAITFKFYRKFYYTSLFHHKWQHKIFKK